MSYYINPIWFYLCNVCDSIRITFLLIGGVSFFFSTVGSVVAYFDGFEVDMSKELKTCKKVCVISGIVLFLGLLTPSKQTCMEMMIASLVTHENVTEVKSEVYEIVDYVVDKLDSVDD